MAIELIDTVMRACRCRITNPIDKLILLVIANYANDEGLAWPAKQTLLRDCALEDAECLRRRLRALEDHSLISTVPGQGRTSSRYQLDLAQLKTHAPSCAASSSQKDSASRCEQDSQQPESSSQKDSASSSQKDSASRSQKDRSVIDPSLIPHSNHRTPAQTQPAAERKESEPKPIQSQGRSQEPDKAPERSDAEVNEAWRQLVQAAGPRLASARAMSRAQWLAWAELWQQSGGQIDDARLVGRWIAHGGLDWLKKSKTSWIASNWADCLAQALEDPKTRTGGPTRAGEAPGLTQVFKRAETIPQESLEDMAKLGIRVGGAP